MSCLTYLCPVSARLKTDKFIGFLWFNSHIIVISNQIYIVPAFSLKCISDWLVHVPAECVSF